MPLASRQQWTRQSNYGHNTYNHATKNVYAGMAQIPPGNFKNDD
jgi:hypothetical protein